MLGKTKMRAIVPAAILAAGIAAAFAPAPFAAADGAMVSGFDLAVGEAGDLTLPDVDFRAEWTMLGSWTVNGDDGADGIHVVYTQPGVAAAFRETGVFPDGAVLIKELLSGATEDLTTGNISYAGEVEGWFVMVKDSAGRYPGNTLWGDGWGWGFFEANDPGTLVTTDYVAECKSCHIPARATDWIYTRAYPVLRSD